jgi:hypothetical protein
MIPVTIHSRLLATITAALWLLALAIPAAAQDENALKEYFEGKHVTVRLDMPGSADGVDVRLDPAAGIDLQEYRNDLRRYGTALYAGDSAVVTLVKVKKDLIEFQIGGGGFGTFGDDTNTSSGIQLIDKTEREKTLERRIRGEQDRDRRRSLQRELDELRDRRERDNRRLRAEGERIEAINRTRVAEQRLRGGSRFNLRYAKAVPSNFAPKDLVAALTEYVDFENRPPAPPAPQRDISLLRKGMLRSEAERTFGAPVSRSQRGSGAMVTITLVFDLGDQEVHAEFVEDVLIRYSITSK